MEYRILGPLEVSHDGVSLRLGGVRQQRILATLILGANHTVSISRLTAAAWGKHPPTTARRQVQNRIATIRAMLTAAGAATALTTTPGGYRLSVDPEQVDAFNFEALVACAADAGALREALELWRGPALAGLGGEFLARKAAALEEKRIGTLQRCLELELAAGAPVIAELTALIQEHPLRERPVALLMTALYRAGRQGEALAAYRDLAARLADELGLDPGTDLQDLHGRILRADPALKSPAGSPRDPLNALCLLPSDIADFTGRADQVAELGRLLRPGDSATAVVVSAIAGKGGVGKTALAVHAAHRLRTEFPDGQLYVSLDGAGPQPSDPAGVLDGLLRALGVDGRLIPPGLPERAALYRSRLAGRRVLVVLDNAADETQVRPLLPGSSTCAVLITSRSRLAGLEGARTVDLDVLPPGQAIELLGRVAGPQRVAAEPAAADEIVRLCGYLPLAVRVAGARLAARRHRPLAWLASRLANEHRRLDELSAGDLEVRASFALSYAGLAPELQRAFRVLGLVRAPDFAPWVLSALLDAPLEVAEDLLERLVDAQLVETGDGGRYRMHDLLRVYAREKLQPDEPLESRAASLERFVGACLWLVERAIEHPSSRAYAAIHSGAARWPLPPEATKELTAYLTGWFQTERDVLVEAVRLACEAGLDEAAWDLAFSMSELFSQTSHRDGWSSATEIAYRAVRQAGNRRGEAALTLSRGMLEGAHDRGDRASVLSAQARAMAEEVGDRYGAAVAEAYWAATELAGGRYLNAERAVLSVLPVLRDTGDLRTQVYALRILGATYLGQGRFADATSRLEEGLELAHRSGYRFGKAYLMCWLSRVYAERYRRVAEAASLSERAHKIFVQLGDRNGQANALVDCAARYWRQGRTEDTVAAAEHALRLSREVNDKAGEAYALRLLGAADVHVGRPAEAIALLHRSVDISREIGRVPFVAQALVILGEAYAATGNSAAAGDAWQQAASLFDQLGSPLPDSLARKLADQGQLTHSSVPSAKS